MTASTSLRAGLADAWGRPKLVATVWAWNLLLALLATLPLSRWLRGALPQSPEADLLASRFSFGMMSELSQDAGPAMALVWAAASGALLLGFLAGPLLAGGILESLGSGDNRSFFHRFFRGAGHFYGRFLRLMLLATAGAVVVAGLVAAVLGAALRPLRESAWEPGELLSAVILGAAVLAVLAVFWLSLDFARVQVSRDDSRRMWRALMSGLHFTLHFRGRTLGLLARTWLLLLVLAGVYLLFRAGVPSHTAALIALLFLVQQAFMLARTGLRIAQVSAERQMHLALRPAVGVAPVVVTPLPAAVPVLDAPTPAAAPALDVAPELRVDQG